LNCHPPRHAETMAKACSPFWRAATLPGVGRANGDCVVLRGDRSVTERQYIAAASFRIERLGGLPVMRLPCSNGAITASVEIWSWFFLLIAEQTRTRCLVFRRPGRPNSNRLQFHHGSVRNFGSKITCLIGRSFGRAFSPINTSRVHRRQFRAAQINDPRVQSRRVG